MVGNGAIHRGREGRGRTRLVVALVGIYKSDLDIMSLWQAMYPGRVHGWIYEFGGQKILS